jgi:tetratricopeptide (TPR) repeat protein
MSECRDKRFRDMIHAYELGMLTDDDRRRFEIHMLECDSCFALVERSKATSRLLNTDKSIREVVDRTDRENTPDKNSERSRPTERRVWSRMLPMGLAAAAVLVLLIVQPWDIQFRSTQEAVAAENRLAVLYFENLVDLTDSSGLSPVATNLLISDLGQTKSVIVVSSARLYDIARQMGFAGPSDLGRDQATAVARTTKSRWTLLGAIVQTEPNVILTAELVDAASGDIDTSFRADGTETEDVFAVVDHLGAEVRAYISPGLEEGLADGPVSQITSQSLTAYRHYLDGVDYTERLEYREAINSFQKAVQHDPQFAMGYYYLSRLLDPALIIQASEHLDRAGRIEQHYIRAAAARYEGDTEGAVEELQLAAERFPDEKDVWGLLAGYYRRQGKTHEAIEGYVRAVELDPFFKTGYNELAYLYEQTGDIEQAVWAVDKYIELAPGEPNPYDTKGDILSRNGRLAEAIEAYERALELAPDFYHSRMYLGYMYIYAGRYAEADSCFQALTYADNQSLRFAAYTYYVYPSLHRGKLRQALERIAENLEIVGTPRAIRVDPGQRLLPKRLKITVLREQGDFNGALEVVDECLRIASRLAPPDTVGYRDHRVILLAEKGDLEAATVELLELEAIIAATEEDISGRWLARGVVELESGNYDSAIAAMRRSVEMEPSFLGSHYLGRAYLAAGQYNRAVDQFKTLVTEYSSPRSFYGIESVKMHYYLGQAYEQLGRTDEAMEQYVTFLDIWREADHDPPSLADARERLAGLRALP